MPVIRGVIRKSTLTAEKRKELIEHLECELAGQTSSSEKIVLQAPLIFEIPLERLDGTSDRMDVVVVWDALEDLRGEERSALIMDAYGEKADSISLALGVTRVEAIEQSALPYRMTHHEMPGEVDGNAIQKAMLEEGGFQFGGKVVLYLPTRKMADAALMRLYEKIPRGAWAIAEAVSH